MTYNPNLGKFLERDPAGPVDGMNLQEYVRSNPVTFVDSSGAQAVSTSRPATSQPSATQPGQPGDGVGAVKSKDVGQIFIDSKDFIVTGTIKVDVWLGRTTPFDELNTIFGKVKLWQDVTLGDHQTYVLKNSILESIEEKAGLGRMTWPLANEAAKVPAKDTSAYKSTVPLKVTLPTSFQFVDENKKPVSSLMKAYVEVHLDLKISTRLACDFLVGKITTTVEGSTKVQEPGKQAIWAYQPKETVQFNINTCKNPALARIKAGVVKGVAADRREFLAGDYLVLKIIEGSFTWSIKVEADAYRYGSCSQP